jgi:hypothetical protein
MDEKKAIIAALSLLVLALVGIIVVGALISTLQGVKGEDGKQGPRGPQGVAPSPISGSLSQVQTNFTLQNASVVQAASVVTLRVNATLVNNLNPATTYVLATLSGVTLPSTTVTGTVYLLNSSSQAAVTIGAQDGNVILGPIPITWSSAGDISLSATYMAQ